MKDYKLKQLIKVQDKFYNVLGMYGGSCYLSSPYDTNNEVVSIGVIWEMQPFYWEKEIRFSKLIKLYFNIIRLFKSYANKI
jgi:hypothetical protein